MFIPIKDDVPTVRKPILTVGLIITNVLVFLWTYAQGFQSFQMTTVQFGYIPYELVHLTELTPELSAPIFLTPFTSMFMHGGWMHLIGNMLFLWIYGNNVEDYFGPVKFILFYLVSGLAAIFLFTLFDPSGNIPLVGASGAIAGVMGAYMVLYPRAKVTVMIILFFIQFVYLPAKVVLGFWFIYQVFMSLTGNLSGGGVAWAAHVGGFLFGWMLLKIIIKFRGKGSIPSGGQRIYRMQW